MSCRELWDGVGRAVLPALLAVLISVPADVQAECATWPWVSARWEAKKGLLSAALEVNATVQPAERAGEQLRDWPVAGARLPADTCAVLLESFSRVSLSGESRSVTWVEPGWGVLQETSVSGRRTKIRRHGAAGLHSWTEQRDRRGAIREVRERHAEWKREAPVVDAASLLGSLGGPAVPDLLAVRSGASLVTVRVTASGPTRSVTSRAFRGGARTARVLELDVVSAGESGEEVEIAGLTPPVIVLVDLATGVPLSFEGRMQGLGHVRANLVAVTLPSGP